MNDYYYAYMTANCQWYAYKLIVSAVELLGHTRSVVHDDDNKNEKKHTRRKANGPGLLFMLFKTYDRE